MGENSRIKYFDPMSMQDMKVVGIINEDGTILKGTSSVCIQTADLTAKELSKNQATQNAPEGYKDFSEQTRMFGVCKDCDRLGRELILNKKAMIVIKKNNISLQQTIKNFKESMSRSNLAYD